jgi:hypothetical protein
MSFVRKARVSPTRAYCPFIKLTAFPSAIYRLTVKNTDLSIPAESAELSRAKTRIPFRIYDSATGGKDAVWVELGGSKKLK